MVVQKNGAELCRIYLRVLVLIMVICSGLITADYSWSTEILRKLQIDFSFDVSQSEGSSVIAYRLYKEGNLVCEEDSEVGQSITCTVAIDDQLSSYFTLSALYDDGTESPQSPPFMFTVENPVKNRNVALPAVLSLLLAD